MAALGHQQPLTSGYDLAQKLPVIVEHLCSQRHRDIEVLPRTTGLVGALAMATALGGVDRTPTQVIERIQARVTNQMDTATVPPITA